MKRPIFLAILILVAFLFLASCGSASTEITQSDDPYAIFTQAAQTAKAKGQELTNITSTPPPTSISATSIITSTLQVGPTSTGEAATTQATSSVEDKAEFVRDVSIPDSTEIPPNGRFTKTWRLKNIGSTTWTTDYKVVFIGGDRMGAAEAIPLTEPVSPNQDVDISVDLTAPDAPGTYTGYFNLQNQNGGNFGVGVGSIEAFWVEVVVSEDAQPLATNTPSVSPDVVTQIFLYVDAANVNQCPHTYNLTGIITLSSPAQVSYQLDVQTDKPGIEISLPDPVTTNLGAGSHTFNYQLSFTSAIKGTIYLHITSPGDQLSNPVNFSLTCP